MIRWLERIIRPIAVPNLTAILLAGQAFFFLMGMVRPKIVVEMLLVPRRVLDGEVWRLLAFLFIPPTIDFSSPGYSFNILFFLLFIYIYWLFGSALEHDWGAARYNLFIAIGYVANIAIAFIVPDGVATNAFIFGSIFLAFAYVFPDFIIYVFFLLPVKIKWVAAVTWVGYGLMFLIGNWMIKLLILASTLNFLLFFGREIVQRMWRAKKTMERQVTQKANRDEAFHKCIVCGRTDKSDPKLEFRYCNRCTGAPCYCIEHVKTHEHK